MSTEFDISKYLANRVPSTTSGNSAAKHAQLVVATKEKQDAFNAGTQAANETTKTYKSTWAGGLGLSQGDMFATPVNLGARAVASGGRLLGNFGGGGADILGAAQLKGISDDTLQAYARYQQGQANEEDLVKLNTSMGP